MCSFLIIYRAQFLKMGPKRKKKKLNNQENWQISVIFIIFSKFYISHEIIFLIFKQKGRNFYTSFCCLICFTWKLKQLAKFLRNNYPFSIRIQGKKNSLHVHENHYFSRIITEIKRRRKKLSNNLLNFLFSVVFLLLPYNFVISTFRLFLNITI